LNSIAELEEAVLDFIEVEIETVHSFCDGMYSRQITMPKNAVVVGAKHKTEFFMVVSKGKCIIKDDDDEMVLTAPAQVISRVGAKRAIFAIEETVITTFHPTKETNIEKITAEITDESDMVINNIGRLIN